MRLPMMVLEGMRARLHVLRGDAGIIIAASEQLHRVTNDLTNVSVCVIYMCEGVVYIRLYGVFANISPTRVCACVCMRVYTYTYIYSNMSCSSCCPAHVHSYDPCIRMHSHVCRYYMHYCACELTLSLLVVDNFIAVALAAPVT